MKNRFLNELIIRKSFLSHTLVDTSLVVLVKTIIYFGCRLNHLLTFYIDRRLFLNLLIFFLSIFLDAGLLSSFITSLHLAKSDLHVSLIPFIFLVLKYFLDLLQAFINFTRLANPRRMRFHEVKDRM